MKVIYISYFCYFKRKTILCFHSFLNNKQKILTNLNYLLQQNNNNMKIDFYDFNICSFNFDF